MKHNPLASALAAALSLAVGGCLLIDQFPDVTPDPPGGDGGAGGGASVNTSASGGGASSTGTSMNAGGGGAGMSTGDLAFAKGFGDVAEQQGTAIAASGSEVLVTGFASGTIDFGNEPLPEMGNSGKLDTFLAKLDASANRVWSKRFQDCVAHGVAVSGSGDVIVVGEANGDVDFGGGLLQLSKNNTIDVFVARFYASGQHRWSKLFGNGPPDQMAYAVAVDGAGNSVVAGTFAGNLDFGAGPVLSSAGGTDIFVAKFNPDGAALWSKRFGDSAGPQAASAVAIDAQGNVIVAGSFRGSINLGGQDLTTNGGADVFVAKLDASGDHIWSKSSGSPSDDEAHGVAVDANGDVYLTGHFRSSVVVGPNITLTSAGGEDAFLVKLDPSGKTLWGKSFGNSANQRAVGVAADAAGNVVVTGAFSGQIDFGKGPSSSAGSNDGFVAKLDPTGAPLWARAFGGAADQGGATVALSPLGQSWITGYFAGTTDFGGGKVIASQGANDVFVAQYGP